MSSPRIVVAYDRLDPVPAWAEFMIGTIKLPTAINLDLSPGAPAMLWEEVPHLTLVRRHRRTIVLADVKFATFNGYRAGCHPTGLLGIAEGVVREPARFEATPVAVKFDPHAGQFLRLDTGRPVTRTPLLLLTPVGAYGHFPPPANALQQHLQKGEYFEPNASV